MSNDLMFRIEPMKPTLHNMQRIVSIAADQRGINPHQLLSKKRTDEIYLARSLALIAIHQLTGADIQVISRELDLKYSRVTYTLEEAKAMLTMNDGRGALFREELAIIKNRAVPPDKRRQVVIEVICGVARVVSHPPGIQVKIITHDLKSR